MRPSRHLALLAALTLAVASCGTSDPGDAAGLPVNPDPSDSGQIAGACLEGEPECNDTPGDLPPPGDIEDETLTPSPALVDGGLTVSEALATDAEGTIAVQGFVIVADGTSLLCDALAESFPPQCGGDSIEITGFEQALGVPITSAQGVSWTDEHVTFFGEIVDGTFVVDPTTQG